MKKIEIVSDGSSYFFESEELMSFRVGTGYSNNQMYANGLSGGIQSSELAGALYVSERLPNSTAWKTVAVFKTWEHVQEIG